MQEAPDEQLMRRYADGDAQAFEQLYARHRSSLYRYFRRQVADAATANDLYQGTWEKIIRARRSYRHGAKFAVWMYRIAHNHLVDHWRGTRPSGGVETDSLPDRQAGPLEDALATQQGGQLAAAIATLPAEQRNALLLKLESGLKMDQIASVTGVSKETVKSRLRYAVDKLKQALGE